MAMDKNIKLTINGKSNNKIKKACGEICGDNRFEVIEKYKKKLIEATNIETSKDEIAVIDNILFRFWQMKWLDKLDEFDRQKQQLANERATAEIAAETISRQDAEIKRLEKTAKIYNAGVIHYKALYKTAKSEAIKEFEYRITMECAKVMTIFQLDVMKEIIEDVKQEMVGDDNG